MILAVHSDASYLSEPKARSRAGGHFFLSNNAEMPPNNGAILNLAHVIKNVMASATEAELAALFINACEAVYIRIILESLATNNHLLHCKPTMLWPMLYAMVKFNLRERKQWTWDSIGYETENANSNLKFIGDLENWITQTIGPNTMQLLITRTWEKNFSRQALYSKCYEHDKPKSTNWRRQQHNKYKFLCTLLQGCDDLVPPGT